MELTVIGLPSNSYAMTNCVYVHAQDFAALRAQSPFAGPESDDEVKAHGIHIILGEVVFSCRVAPEKCNPGQICVGGLQRRVAALSLNDAKHVNAFNAAEKAPPLATLGIEIDMLMKKRNPDPVEIDCPQFEETFKKVFGSQVFAPRVQLAMDFLGTPFKVTITTVAAANVAAAGNIDRGQYIGSVTALSFAKAKEAPIKLTGQGSSTGAKIFRPDFDFNKLGIGGLDNEFADIFRRAFASRVFPPSLVQKMGMEHVRGLLLYGPPGCGKTLIARKIGQVLNAREPKIVNGPEILNKYVGASEENIRELFKDAEEEQAEMGDDSELHIIIFDELDAICKSRGSSRDGTGVGDSVVNQLLSKIDGVDSLNNILIIGMTNRKDMMDEALLRPGRFEVHVEIGLPNEEGRLQILTIHTGKMRDNGFLGQDVIDDIDTGDSELARATKNYSGAEIAGLIRNAASQAFQRGVDPKKFSSVDLKNFKPKLTLADIQQALSETKPSFGVDDSELSAFFRNGIVHYGPAFTSLLGTLESLVQQVRSSDKTPLLSVLLEGPAQSGKTALAAKIAAESDFPFVRMLTADKLIGYSESAKCNHVFKLFQDSWKSPLSMIIIDDIERCLDYTPIGPRFSNQVLQAMLVLIKKNPPVEGRKLMVVGITSIPHLLEDMELTRVFNVSLHVPNLQEPDEIKSVLQQAAPMPSGDLERIASAIKEPIGVKKLLMVTEMARQEKAEGEGEGPGGGDAGDGAVSADRFLECLANCGL